MSGGAYEVSIGLEVHVQLATRAKLFAPEKNDFGAEPNTDISAVTLAHPGTLPVLNRQAVEWAVKLGLAVEGRISREMIFDRKNYFYPDLPKGYQITQDSTPVCVGGGLDITLSDGRSSRVELIKIHLEEDAGKSIHTAQADGTLIDLNRSGVPLVEIVTQPVIHSAEEAMVFLKEIRKLVRYLEISDGNMEEGSMRCDVNISLCRPGEALGSKVEVKNMNSIRNVGRAIQYEIKRQGQMLDQGNSIVSETRAFDAGTGETLDMRTKEQLNDYRYMTEPDLPPIVIHDEWMEHIQAGMPKLPQEVKAGLMSRYGLPEYDAGFISEERAMVDFFEECAGITKHFKQVANWIMGPIRSYLNEHQIDIREIELTPVQLSELIEMVDKGRVSHTVADRELLPRLLGDGTLDVADLATELNIVQIGNPEVILRLIEEVLEENQHKVKQYQAGKKGLVGMFMGQVMQKAEGSVDPRLTRELLVERLEKNR